jgi:hypothetical protein
MLLPEKVPPTSVPLMVSVLLTLHAVLTLPHEMSNDTDWPGVRFSFGAFQAQEAPFIVTELTRTL